MDDTEEERFIYKEDGRGNFIFRGRVIPQVPETLAPRVTGYFQIDGGEEIPVQLREIYFDLWDEKRWFFLTALDESTGTEVKLIGEGLKAGTSYPISYRNTDVYARFDREGITTGKGFRRRMNLDGTLLVRFVEGKTGGQGVEGNFSFSYQQDRPGDPYVQNVSFTCTGFNVVSRNHNSSKNWWWRFCRWVSEMIKGPL